MSKYHTFVVLFLPWDSDCLFRIQDKGVNFILKSLYFHSKPTLKVRARSKVYNIAIRIHYQAYKDDFWQFSSSFGFARHRSFRPWPPCDRSPSMTMTSTFGDISAYSCVCKTFHWLYHAKMTSSLATWLEPCQEYPEVILGHHILEENTKFHRIQQFLEIARKKLQHFDASKSSFFPTLFTNDWRTITWPEYGNVVLGDLDNNHVTIFVFQNYEFSVILIDFLCNNYIFIVNN